MKQIFFFPLVILSSFVIKAQAPIFYKSASGKLFTQSQIDSIITERNERFKGIKTELQVTGRKVEKDTTFLYYSFIMTQIENEMVYDSENLKNVERLRTFLGKPLPHFEFQDIHGKLVKSSDLKGKPVVINFWFTTCPPCIEEMSELNKIQGDYKNTDVIFLSMTFDSRENVQQFLKKREFNYRAISDAKSYIDQFTTLYPTTLFINREGIITQFMNGMASIVDEKGTTITSHKVDSSGFLNYLNQIVQ